MSLSKILDDFSETRMLLESLCPDHFPKSMGGTINKIKNDLLKIELALTKEVEHEKRERNDQYA